MKTYPEIYSTYARSITEELKSRLLSSLLLTEGEELRALGTPSLLILIGILDILEVIFTKANNNIEYNISPTQKGNCIQIELIKGLLRCKCRENRLSGVLLLQNRITNIKKSQFGQVRRTSGNKIKILQDIIIKGKVIRSLFTDYSPGELGVKYYDLIEFMIRPINKLQNEDIETIWTCCISLNPESPKIYQKGYLTVLLEIMKLLPISQIYHLYSLIRSLEAYEHNDQLLHFRKLFILQINELYQNQKVETKKFKISNNLTKEIEIENEQLLDMQDLTIFWQLINEAYPGRVNLKDQALENIILLLKLPDLYQFEVPFVTEALLNIKRHKSVIRSFTFYMMTFLSKGYYLGELEKKTYSKVLKVTNDRYQIMNNLIQYLGKYHKKISQKTLLEYTRNEILQKEFRENVSHGKTMKSILQFIGFLMTNSDLISLTPLQMDKLWDIYIENPIIKEEADYLFRALSIDNQVKSQQINRRFEFLSNKLAKELFHNYLSNKDKFNYKKINKLGYNCFKKYFIWVNNIYDETPEIDFVAAKDITNFHGFDILHKIGNECTNDEVIYIYIYMCVCVD